MSTSTLAVDPACGLAAEEVDSDDAAARRAERGFELALQR